MFRQVIEWLFLSFYLLAQFALLGTETGSVTDRVLLACTCFFAGGFVACEVLNIAELVGTPHAPKKEA